MGYNIKNEGLGNRYKRGGPSDPSGIRKINTTSLAIGNGPGVGANKQNLSGKVTGNVYADVQNTWVVTNSNGGAAMKSPTGPRAGSGAEPKKFPGKDQS